MKIGVCGIACEVCPKMTDGTCPRPEPLRFTSPGRPLCGYIAGGTITSSLPMMRRTGTVQPFSRSGAPGSRPAPRRGGRGCPLRSAG
ncbi:MAG: hypothetical protein PWP08_1291 [Methanofollis sp.]|nr:hypothetical protein [Methanofollis sp.]